MKKDAPTRDLQMDESMGHLSRRRIARGRRPFFENQGFPVLGRLIWLCHEGHLRVETGASTLRMMRRAFAIVMIFLAMFWVASPALACLLPGRDMTAAEQACCKQMAKMCGSPHMPQSHSCCQKEAQPENTSILVAHYQFAPALQVIATLSTPFKSREFALGAAAIDQIPPSNSPPDSFALRI